MHALIQALSWDIEKRTVEKGQTNATSVTMPLHAQTIWRDIWKHTMEKSQTNATNVTNMTMPFLWLVWVGEWQDFLQSTYTCMYRRTNSIKVFTHPPNLLWDAKTLLYIIKRLYKLKCYAKVLHEKFWHRISIVCCRSQWPLTKAYAINSCRKKTVIFRTSVIYCFVMKHCQRYNGPKNWLRDLD